MSGQEIPEEKTGSALGRRTIRQDSELGTSKIKENEKVLTNKRINQKRLQSEGAEAWRAGRQATQCQLQPRQHQVRTWVARDQHLRQGKKELKHAE